MNKISNLIIPIMVLSVVIYGIYKKINIYDVFIDGAKESFEMIFTIFPYLLGMMLAINLFLHSNFLEIISNFISPVLNLIGIPFEIVPMAIMRPISGTSSLAILNNIFESFGPDSFVGRLASTIQGSTDTTFYVLTLYFGSIGIKKIRYGLIAGLFADLIGIIASIVIVQLVF